MGSITPKKIVFFVLKLVFVGVLFHLIFNPGFYGFKEDLFQNITPGSLWEELRELSFASAAPWFAFAAVVKLLGIFAGVVRWRLLLKGQGIHIPFWYLTKCWFMGRAIGLLLPGTLGLDAYRFVESSRYTGEAIKCATVWGVEKLTGLIALFTLVFLTLPLGLGLFEFNYVVLGAVLVVLAGFITFCFLLLLNPRVAQVITHVVPAPAFVKNKIQKLGVAVTAYHGQRTLLVKAVICGLMVHLAICLMYFGTASAMRAENTSIFDILFVAPFIILISVFTPTVSGMGVREIVMGTMLGAQAGAAKAVTFGHMGFWFGEIIPLALSIPLLLFTTRPNREQLLSDVEAAHKAAENQEEESLHFTPEELARYRKGVWYSALAGVCAGVVCGAMIGIAEACWHVSISEGLIEWTAFGWAPLVYGLVFSGVGLGIAGGLVFLYLLFDRFAPTPWTFGLAAGGALAAAVLGIGRFRYVRDVLEEHAPTISQNLAILGTAAGIGIAATLLGIAMIRFAGRRDAWKRGAIAAGVAYVALVAGGFIYANVNAPEREQPAFADESSGKPNIILVAVDTLRADFLPMYRPDTAQAKTPNLAAFTQDAVLFQHAFAQSSWTKASFGTIFSGMYPEGHSATGKASALPDDVVTFPEVLRDGGYYTRGFANNANISTTFNYDQGFLHYTDLKRDLLFGAQASSEKLVIYDILRKVYQAVTGRLFKQRIVITDFYQPANAVTDRALEWIDSDERPKNAPFFLFTHYMDPHDPFRDPERPGKGYARVQMGNPDPDEYKEAFIRSYNYEIEFMDTHVGRLLDGLKERNLYNDTLIVFTSDHGEEFCEHGGWWHGLSLYDEQIAVPFIIKLPGNAVAGRTNPYLTRHIDLGPTLLWFAGSDKPETMLGQSLFFSDFQPANGLIQDTYAALDFEGIELQAVRTNDRKLIRSNENKRNYAPIELYDMKSDPKELVNLAGKNLAEEAELLELVDSALERAKADAVAAQEVDIDAVREQMEAQGYLGDDTED